MTSNRAPLGDERYVSLETFRKDGTGVKTPVWAAPLDGHLVIFSEGKAYKIKRLRNDPKARVAGCDVRGKVHGEWLSATARIVEDRGEIARAHRALREKYGWQLAILDFFAGISGKIAKRAYVEVTFADASVTS